jgi:putative ABC transport system permease protein
MLLFDTFLRDLQTALRQLRLRPSLAILAITTLAVGIGANIAVFAIVNSVLLQPLPYGTPDRLAILWSNFTSGKQARVPSSGPALMELRSRSRSFQQIAGIWGTSGTFTGEGEPEQVRVGMITANFFSTLQVRPKLGRGFVPEEEGRGSANAIVLSYGLFLRRFGGDAAIVNRTVYLNGRPVTVVGVMPREFRMVWPADASIPEDIQAWIPFREDIRELPRDQNYLRLVGRLSPGVTASEANAEIGAIAQQLRTQYPEYKDQGLDFSALDFHADVVRELRPALLGLLGAVFAIVLLACANVAHLLLTRSDERQLEITVRTALGASPSRLVRQLLTESLVLATLGSLTASAVAFGILRLYPIVRPQQLAAFGRAQPDWRVLLFALAITVFSAVVFGIAPALAVRRQNLVESLKAGARNVVGSHRLRRRTLVVVEMALGFLLLVAAGLLSRTMVSALRLNPGFESAHVITFQLALPATRYATATMQAQAVRALQTKLAAVAGVSAVGASSHVPFGTIPANWYGPYFPEGTGAEEQNSQLADQRSITPGYFRALGITTVAGRDFTDDDVQGHLQVAVVDEELARKTWPGRDAVGQKLNIEVISPDEGFVRAWVTVVGVVGHVKDHALLRGNRSQIYVPLAQSVRFPITFVVRSDRGIADLTPELRQAVSAVDKDLPLANLRPMSAYIENARSQTTVMARLSQAFAFIALLLCCVGVFGVVSAAVTQQTREIGIRMALGATPTAVVRMVLRNGLSSVIIGLALGEVLSLMLAPLLSSFLFGVKPIDPLTMLVAALSLLAIAFGASYIPARRAAGTDPMQALRWE